LVTSRTSTGRSRLPQLWHFLLPQLLLLFAIQKQPAVQFFPCDVTRPIRINLIKEAS
jgi:hypothetical protein